MQGFVPLSTKSTFTLYYGRCGSALNAQPKEENK